MAGLDPLTAALGLGNSIIERLFPDPAAKAAAQLQLLDMASKGDLAQLTAQSSIITAEASSDSWLTKTWRPILMLVFAGLIVARWLGLASPAITEAEYMKLWDIIQLGIGGYVIGRSGEKILPAIAEVLKK